MQFTSIYFTRHTLFNLNYFINTKGTHPIYKVTYPICVSDSSQNIVISSSSFFLKNVQSLRFTNAAFVVRGFNPFGFVLPVGTILSYPTGGHSFRIFDFSWVVSYYSSVLVRSNISFGLLTFRLFIFIFFPLIFTKFFLAAKRHFLE